jgi:hypothetical protein
MCEKGNDKIAFNLFLEVFFCFLLKVTLQKTLKSFDFIFQFIDMPFFFDSGSESKSSSNSF